MPTSTGDYFLWAAIAGAAVFLAAIAYGVLQDRRANRD